MKKAMSIWMWAFLVLLLVSCKQEEDLSQSRFLAEGPGQSEVTPIPGEDWDGLFLTAENTVCDPLEKNGSKKVSHGLLGSLYYSDVRYNRAQDYIQNGTKADVYLILSHLNVPTRKFDLGFETESGHLVLNSQGEPLYEDFALNLESTLMLREDQEPGFYEFSVLGDDGVNLFIDEEKVIGMDFATPTRMGCDHQYFYMDHSTRLKFNLEYFQGPRYHIALVMLWRRVGLNEPSEKNYDPRCNQSGNSHWFNFNTIPSTPKAPYLDLINRGWEVIQPENFILNEKVKENPCDSDDDDGYNPSGGVIGV